MILQQLNITCKVYTLSESNYSVYLWVKYVVLDPKQGDLAMNRFVVIPLSPQDEKVNNGKTEQMYVA